MLFELLRVRRIRPAKSLQVSLGVRQEIQTQVDAKWNFAPRAAFTWNATKKTTMRGGYGIFYDWYDSGLYEQTIRLKEGHLISKCSCSLPESS